MPSFISKILNGIKQRTPIATQPAAPVQPYTTSSYAPGFPKYEDDAYNLDRDAYRTIAQCAPVLAAMKKVGDRLAARRVTAVPLEDNDAHRVYAEKVNKLIIQRSVGLAEAIKWLSWGIVEGVRFCDVVARNEGAWLVPDLRGGGRRKLNAGGNIEWDGSSVVKVREFKGLGPGVTEEDREAQLLDRGRIMVWRPGAGSNPEGDLELAVVLYNIARNYQALEKNLAEYSDRHILPIRVFMEKVQGLRPDQVQSHLGTGAEKLQQASRGGTIALDALTQSVKNLEPSGTTSQVLIEFRRELESQAHKLILNNATTTGPVSTGPDQRGDSQVHERAEDVMIENIAHSMEQGPLLDLADWIHSSNYAALEVISSRVGLAQPPHIRLTLDAESEEKGVTPENVRALYESGAEVLASDFYGAHGLEVPEGVAPVIKKEQSSPFGDMGGFGGGFGGGQPASPSPSGGQGGGAVSLANRWITIGSGEDEEGNPTGGRRVEIDEQGRITKGLSRGAQGKTLGEAFGDKEATFGGGEASGETSLPSGVLGGGRKPSRFGNILPEVADAALRDGASDEALANIERSLNQSESLAANEEDRKRLKKKNSRARKAIRAELERRGYYDKAREDARRQREAFSVAEKKAEKKQRGEQASKRARNKAAEEIEEMAPRVLRREKTLKDAKAAFYEEAFGKPLPEGKKQSFSKDAANVYVENKPGYGPSYGRYIVKAPDGSYEVRWSEEKLADRDDARRREKLLGFSADLADDLRIFLNAPSEQTASNELQQLQRAAAPEITEEIRKAAKVIAEQLAAGKEQPKIPESTAMAIAKVRALADLAGRARTMKQIDAAKVLEPIVQLTSTTIAIDVVTSAQLPYDEAIADFAARNPVVADSAEQVAELYRQGRFTAARLTRDTLVRDVQQKLIEAMQEGTPLEDFADWFEENVPEASYNNYAETVFRTNVNTAYSAGRVRQMEGVNAAAEQLGDLPPVVGFEYVTVGDARVRDNHAALDGKVFPLNKLGERFMPPNGFNCRCTAIPVFRSSGATPISDAEMRSLAKLVDPGFFQSPDASAAQLSAEIASNRIILNRWITIGDPDGKGGGKGRRVEIDEEGNVVKGLSREAEGKPLRQAVDDLSAKGDGDSDTLASRAFEAVSDAGFDAAIATIDALGAGLSFAGRKVKDALLSDTAWGIFSQTFPVVPIFDIGRRIFFRIADGAARAVGSQIDYEDYVPKWFGLVEWDSERKGPDEDGVLRFAADKPQDPIKSATDANVLATMQEFQQRLERADVPAEWAKFAAPVLFAEHVIARKQPTPESVRTGMAELLAETGGELPEDQAGWVEKRLERYAQGADVKLANRWISVGPDGAKRPVEIDEKGRVVKGLSEDAQGQQIDKVFREAGTFEDGKNFSDLTRDQRDSLRKWWDEGGIGDPPVDIDGELLDKQSFAQAVSSTASAVGRALKSAPKDIVDKVRSMPASAREWIASKRAQISARRAMGESAAKAIGTVALTEVANVVKSSVLNTEAEMRRAGVPKAVARPLAVLSGVVKAAPISPGTVALSALGQGWVNAIPGFTVAEGSITPKIVKGISKIVKKVRGG